MYVGAGRMSKLLVFERSQVLGTDLRPRFELGKVELLAETGLPEAGADVEHERGSVDAYRTGAKTALLAAPDVLQERIDDERDDRREGHADADDPEDPAGTGDSTAPPALEQERVPPLRPSCERDRRETEKRAEGDREGPSAGARSAR